MGMVASKMGAVGGWQRQQQTSVKDGHGTRTEGSEDHASVIKIKRIFKQRVGYLVMEPTELDGDNRLPFSIGTRRICGEGGYGVVFESTHVDTNTTIAVKMLSPERFHEHFALSAFEREGQFLKSIQQGNSLWRWMPKFYGSGTFVVESHKVPWVSMEFLDTSLVNFPTVLIDLDRASIYIQMIEALESMHGLGHVHRDVKPENFMIRRRQDREEDVVLIDYGLVQSIEESALYNDSWAFCGTVLYASNRQLLGLPTGPLDDLESLAYCIIVMELEYVPWSNSVSDYDSSIDLSDLSIEYENKVFRREVALERLFENGCLPRYLSKWLKHCKERGHADKPDYALLKRLILLADQQHLFVSFDDQSEPRKKARFLKQEE